MNLTAQDFLSLVAQLPPNVRRFRAGDFEVELDGPPRAAKVPTAEQAAAAHEAAKPRTPSDIDSLNLPGPKVFVEDEVDA